MSATPKPPEDPFIEGSEGGFGFMPVPELLRLLQVGPLRGADRNKQLARDCRERAEGLRKAVHALTGKGLDVKGASAVAGTFRVGTYVVSIGEGKQREARQVATPAEAAAVAAVFAQQVVELDTAATALEGAAWAAQVLGMQHRD